MDIRSNVMSALVGILLLALVAVSLVFIGDGGVPDRVRDVRVLQYLGLSSLAVLLAIWVTSSVVARRLTLPIEQLTDSLQRMQRGNFAWKVPHQDRDDEIGALARAVVETGSRQRQEISEIVEGAQKLKRQLMVTNNRLDAVYNELESSQTALDSTRGRLGELEIVDSDTGLLNRRFFDQSFNYEWKRIQRNGKPLSVALCRVVDWTVLVDRFGESRANGVIQKIGNLIADTVRTTDLVARYSDDSVVLMLPETPAFNSSRVVEDIRRLISTLEFEPPIRPYEVRAAVGLVASDTREGEGIDFTDRLEEALAKAIAQGGLELGVA